ncbi:hypothetical protein SNE26_07980 [Mucilaginibacter sp. cycad4]|uniref:hypothetical protein n=1 Tax=Mucilaginibacter sp. cycad4 TaxID=3342096 RepID=UPI002AAC3989|nr:hypothetical protein [Mucilaginibacter gossypii]WPV01707.1 hypothetical protein SNE26_07980 [Mucilaginibacter gossypii]
MDRTVFKTKFINYNYVASFIISSAAFYLVGENKQVDKEIINIEFSGYVQRVDYDIKQFPTIEVRDSSYYIGAGYNTDHQMDVGTQL